MQWKDLKVGDVLAFTPEFLEYVRVTPTLRLFLEEIINIGQPPLSFTITEIIIGDIIELRFEWEEATWVIDYEGRFANGSTPVVFDIIDLVRVSDDNEMV